MKLSKKHQPVTCSVAESARIVQARDKIRNTAAPEMLHCLEQIGASIRTIRLQNHQSRQDLAQCAGIDVFDIRSLEYAAYPMDKVQQILPKLLAAFKAGLTEAL